MFSTFLLTMALGDPLALSVTSDLGDLDDAVREQVSARVTDTAAALEHPVAHDAERALSVHVEWGERVNADFRVTLTATTPSGPSVSVFDCDNCTAAELLERTEAHARVSIGILFETEDEAPTPPPPPTVEPPTAPRAAAEPRRKLSGLSWAGVGSMSVGVVGLVTGGVLLGVGETRVTSDPSMLRDFRPAGYVALGVGGVALVTGVVLVLVDRRAAQTTKTAVRRGPDGVRLRF